MDDDFVEFEMPVNALQHAAKRGRSDCSKVFNISGFLWLRLSGAYMAISPSS